MDTEAAASVNGLKITLGEAIKTEATYAKDGLTINGAAGYGGGITVDEDGTFTMTATESSYVLDAVYVDGVVLKSEEVRGKTTYDYTFDSGTTGGGPTLSWRPSPTP